MPRRNLSDATRLAVTLAALTAAPATAQGPSGAWRQYDSPEAAGFSRVQLELARRYADSVRSGAVMVAWRGHVVAAWGDVARKLELHSVRKSLVSALLGAPLAAGRLNLDRTLADAGLDDRTPLTPDEKRARLRDLLSARSGVYLPAAYAAQEQDQARPPRGSHAPNTFFFYNNWDFNAVGVVYERLVAPDLYTAFRDQIASPLGMEDYTPDDGFKVYEPSSSIHPAHTFRMSARDLLRFGQLYLQRGRWNGRQVVSAPWVDESTRPVTSFADGTGYGYLWWTYAAGSFGERYPQLNRFSMFAARGTGGQLLVVIPEAELVIVHRGDTDNGRNVSGRDVWRIVEMTVAARTAAPHTAPLVVAVAPSPFESQLPAPPKRVYPNIDSSLMAEYSGEYTISPEVTARVFVFEGRLFANVSGMGEAQLLSVSDTEFTIMPVPGSRIRFERDSAGRVKRFAASIGRQNMVGTRR